MVGAVPSAYGPYIGPAMDGGLPLTFRCFPHSRHSRYQPPSGLRSRCQRCLPMRHSQGLVIVASLWVSRAGSVKAIQRVQMRVSTPLLLLAYRDPGCYQLSVQVAAEKLRRA
jgi:hypothetical protein